MRKHYDFSKATRGNPYAARLAHLRAESESDEVLPLTRNQLRELQSRIQDSADRTRYCLADVMTPRFILDDNVSEDDYGLKDPDYATLFKSRSAAAAVRALIGARIKIVRCRVNDPPGSGSERPAGNRRLLRGPRRTGRAHSAVQPR